MWRAYTSACSRFSSLAKLDGAYGERVGRFRERAAELPTGVDVELAEDLAQVVLDGAGADEQLGADLGVGVAVAGQACDLDLLGRQHVAGLGGDTARRLAGGQQLAAGARGELVGAHAVEALVGGAQLLAGVGAAVLAAQPFAVEELAAGELDRGAAAFEPLDRLLVAGLIVAHQSPAARFDAERPLGAARLR